MNTTFDIASVRDEFPITERMLYLDSAHQTPLARSVRAAIDAFLTEGEESAGPKPLWLRRIEHTRAQLAALFNADANEIAFTKNTSEGLNMAAHAVPLKAGDNVLLLEGDHPNNAYAWLNLHRKGAAVRFAKVGDSGIADASTFAPLVDARTRAISLSHISFHAGQRHDLASIGALCRERGLYLVVDAMQSVGVVPIDVQAMNISVMAAGTHKGLLVPQGLGLLYVRDRLVELQPTFMAMCTMARPPEDYIARPADLAVRRDAGRFEMGNLNLPGIHALGAALQLINRFGVAQIERHVLALGDHLLAHLDRLQVGLVGPRGRAARAHVYVLNLPVAEWTDYFARRQVRVSPERGGVRISLAMFNTVADIDRLAEIIGSPDAPARGR